MTEFEKYQRMVNLKSEKIELGLADEFSMMVNALNSELSIEQGSRNETIKIWSDLSNLINKSKDRIKTNDSVISSAWKKFDLAIELLNKADKAAKELGLNSKDIPKYNEVKKLGDELYKSVTSLEEDNKRLKGIKM